MPPATRSVSPIATRPRGAPAIALPRAGHLEFRLELGVSLTVPPVPRATTFGQAADAREKYGKFRLPLLVDHGHLGQ